MTELVEHLPVKHEALSSNACITKQTNKKDENLSSGRYLVKIPSGFLGRQILYLVDLYFRREV
jgi:hypothetical protein